MTPRILNSQEIKSDFNSKMLNFVMVFTSYWTCLERWKITIRWIALFIFRTTDPWRHWLATTISNRSPASPISFGVLIASQGTIDLTFYSPMFSYFFSFSVFFRCSLLTSLFRYFSDVLFLIFLQTLFLWHFFELSDISPNSLYPIFLWILFLIFLRILFLVFLRRSLSLIFLRTSSISLKFSFTSCSPCPHQSRQLNRCPSGPV